LAINPLRLTTGIFFQLNTCGHSPYVTSSLTRGLVCHLQLLLALASAVILRSESRGTHDYILLSQMRDFPNLEDQVPAFISLRNRVAQLYPPGTGFPFHRLLQLAGLRWRYSTRTPHEMLTNPQSQSQSHNATDGQSVSQSWCRAQSGAHDQDIYYCLTVTVLFLWGALSDERAVCLLSVIVCSSKSFVIMSRIFTFYMLNMLLNVNKIYTGSLSVYTPFAVTRQLA
jgi:hypothetical protein